MKIVTAAVAERDGQFLIARRAPDQKLAGAWEFPGGKVEPGESLQQCLERELLEELGVHSVASHVITESLYRYEHGEFLLKAIKVDLLSEQFHLTAHDEIRWLPADELLKLDLAPADIPIAEFIRGRLNVA